MSVKAKQEAKQKIAALSYHELLSKQESIQSRLSVIGIGEVHSIGVSVVGTSANNGIGGGGKRGRRRKRSNNTPPPPVPAPAPIVESNLVGRIPNGPTITSNAAPASADSATNNDDNTKSGVGENKPNIQEGQQNLDATKTNESSSIQNDTTTESTSQNINKDNHTNGNKEDATSNATTKTIITPPSKIPFHPKADIQWDFLLAEMKWLSADFQSERKRHTQLARKQSSSMKQFIKTKEKRKMQKLIQMELKRRKLSNKIARDVIKGWWDNKINRIIAYKQKVDAELIKKRSMDRHLIQLVKQTERYSDLLIRNEDNNGANGYHSTMTIEEALQQSDHETKMEECDTGAGDNDKIDEASHRPNVCISSSAATNISNENGHSHDPQSSTIQTRKRRIKIKSEEIENENDQKTTVVVQQEDDQEEFRPLHYNEIDDETTIEAEEKLGRDISYHEEIDLLTKEGEMSVEELRAMYYGAQSVDNNGDDDIKIDENDNDLVENKNRHKMDETMKENKNQSQNIDVMDCTSNTPSIQDSDEDLEKKKEEENEAEEFKLSSSDIPIDDETTIEAEEKLGREMSYEDEIALLNQENEMSIEELKARYYGNGPSNDDEEKDFNSQIEEDNEDVASTEAVEVWQSNIAKTETIDPFAVNDNAPEDEFKPQPDLAVEVDDETTIEAEEKLGREMSYEDEIAMLKRENELSIEDLKKMYVGDMDEHDDINGHGSNNVSIPKVSNYSNEYTCHGNDDGDVSDATSIISNHGKENEEEEEDFVPINPNEIDDETTIEAEEKVGREMSYEQEIEILKRENEMSVEELRNTYLNCGMNRKRKATTSPIEDRMDTKRIMKEDDDGEVGDNDEALEAIRSLEMADAKARNTAVSRPFILAPWVKLRVYQQIGLNWLVSTQTRRLNAILADEMGLGKTLQTISLLSYLACYKGIWGPHLIIVPTSCIVNWEMELKRFAPALKVLCYYGSAKRRKELRQGWTKVRFAKRRFPKKR